MLIDDFSLTDIPAKLFKEFFAIFSSCLENFQLLRPKEAQQTNLLIFHLHVRNRWKFRLDFIELEERFEYLQIIFVFFLNQL